MQKKKKSCTIAIGIISTLLMSSCSNTPNNNLIGTRIYYSNAPDPVLDSTIARHNKLFNLPLFDTSKDNSEYRLWYDDHDTLRMIQLKFGTQQACTVYTTIHEKRNDSLFLIVKSIETKKPAGGWENLLQNMDTLKIDRVADIRSLVKENYLLWEEAPGYVVEVYNKKKRSCFYFVRPYCYKDDLWQANNFCKLLDLLQAQINVTIPASETRNCTDSLVHQPVEYEGKIL